MKKWFNHNITDLLGVISGGIGGYLYWNDFGYSFSKPDRIQPLISTFYGA